MIGVQRPATAPRVLTTRGAAKRAEMEAAYDASPAEYDRRRLRFTFDGALYGHSSVKQALVRAQHGKCAFCESRVGMDGDVEHFRPKAGFVQTRGERVQGAGYYWLAYEWSNLLLACSPCNQRHKRNLFPLADPSVRARSHHHDVKREEPLLIDPGAMDPEDHISFRQEIAFPVNGSRAGAATIDGLRLNRENLNELRRGRLNELRTLRELIEIDSDGDAELAALIAGAKVKLTEASAGPEPFTGLARAAQRAGWYLP